MQFAEKPSNYQYLLKLRNSKELILKPCEYLKPSVKLRSYQAIGTLHLLLLSRMILGDSAGLGKCVSEDTLVYTNKGLIPFKSLLLDGMVEGNFYDLEDSFKVVTDNGWQKATKVYYSGIKEGLRIETDSGFVLEGLPHHPIMASHVKDSFYHFCRLDSLQLLDYACISRKNKFPNNEVKVELRNNSRNLKNCVLPERLDARLSELLGYYVSESINPNDSRFLIIKKDVDIQSKIKALLDDLFYYKGTWDAIIYSDKVNDHSAEIREVFKGLGAIDTPMYSNQVVPNSILCSNKENMAAFLRGYFESSGNIDVLNSRINCSSRSYDFIEQVQQLLLMFGIISIRKIKKFKNFFGKEPRYILYFCGDNIDIFCREIGFVSNRKKKSLELLIDKKRSTNRDVIPFGSVLLKEAMSDIAPHIKSLSDRKSFLKKVTKNKDFVRKGLTYDDLSQFIGTLEDYNLSDHVKNYSVLKDLRDKRIYFDPIKNITKVKKKFVDFYVPNTHNFIGNGFINHNTCQVIAFYAYLKQKDPKVKLLVVAPKSAVNQWAEEFEKFSTGITTHVLTNIYGKMKDGGYGNVEDLESRGVKFKRISGFNARKAQYDSVDTDVLIISYYPVQQDYRFLIENRSPKFAVVFDEAQAFKNEKTTTYFGALTISEKAERAYGLSATIIKNKLEEAYTIYKALIPGLFGSKVRFYREFCIREKMKVWQGSGKKKRYFNKIVGYKNLNEFKDRIDPFFLIRRTREVANELPMLLSKKVMLEMSSSQSKLYKEALSGDLYRRLIKDKYFKIQEYCSKKTVLTDKESDTLDKLKKRYEESLTKEGMIKNKISALSYCQIVSNGPAWLGEEGESSKETEFYRLFEQELFTDKVIVFTRFKSGISRLQGILEKLGMKSVKITGDDKAEDRDKARKLFQESRVINTIFITQAGSAALNLQSAKIILFYDTPWSYGDLYQTIGRAQRIGSIYDHIHLIHMVNKGTIDEHVLEVLETKKELINEIMGDIAEGAINFKRDEIMFKDNESSINDLFNSVFLK